MDKVTVFTCILIGGLVLITAFVDIQRTGGWSWVAWTTFCLVAGVVFEEWQFSRWWRDTKRHK